MYHVDFDTQDEYEYDQDSDSADLDVSFGLDANGVPILPTTIPHVPAPAVDSGDTIPFDTAVAMVTTPVKDPVTEPTPAPVQSPLVAILNKANKETTVVTVTTPIIMAPVSLLSSLRDTLDPAECEEAFLDIIKQNLINNLDYISKDVLAVILGTTTNSADTITKKDNLEKDTDLTLAIEDNSTTITIKENTTSTTLEDDNNTSTLVED